MDVSPILNALNQAQREAVTAPPGHILVLAGAGTGKTRVLVHRIAWLLATAQARPHNILAVTFTNKAAQEMRGRIETLLEGSTRSLWVGTFHGIANRLLRIHWQDAQLPQTFQVMDDDEQSRMIKRILRALGLDEKAWTPQQAKNFINARKEQGLRCQHIVVEGEDAWLRQMILIYANYEETCQRCGLVDFAELLLRAYELLRDHPTLLEQYQQRFTYLLVDEFQDINNIQYQWLQLLAGTRAKVFVVGDDDQSIYSWRGAKVETILNFQNDFPQTLFIRLEENYRSTGMILSAANALIAHNQLRLGKQLWTQGQAGEVIYLYSAYTETDEAQFVIERIQSQSTSLRDQAILYRTTAQSRVFEEVLLRQAIPYRIYGGLRFYERAEIKDVLAYLRLLRYRHDDGAFERVINVPKRGIGDRTVEIIRSTARQQGISLWQASFSLLDSGVLKTRAATLLKTFLDLIESLHQQILGQPLPQQIAQVNQKSGLIEHYKKETKEESQRRLENLGELITAAHEFSYSGKDGVDPLTAFLDHAVLETGEGQGHAFDDCVQLMSLHLAKGLEFDTVFLCGLEEGLFPHQSSIAEGRLEEERRLCYVGMTRARKRLYLSHCETRYRYGSHDSNKPSRFIGELPPELIEDVRLRSPKYRFTARTASSVSFYIGERVQHGIFGEGVILQCEGSGEHTRVQVRFSKEGDKWLIADYADLEKR